MLENFLKRFGYTREPLVIQGKFSEVDMYWKERFPTEETAQASVVKGLIPSYVANPMYGQLRITREGTIFNPIETRKLATCSVVRSCVKRLQSDVMSTPFRIEGGQEDKFRQFLKQPNSNEEPFMSVIGQIVQDVLELDAGVMEKAFGRGAQSNIMKEIYARDGATFFKEIDKHGRLGVWRDTVYRETADGISVTYPEVEYKVSPRRKRGRTKVAYWQYTYVEPIPFEAKEIIYITQHPRTDSPYGQSNVYAVHLEVANLMQGVMSRELILRKSRIPHGILGFEGMTGTEWERFKEYVDKDVMGREHKVVIVGRKPFWIPFSFTDRDMQFLETQQWFTNLVINVFGLTRVVLGLETELKGEAQTQRQLYTQKGLWPLLMLMEHHINTGIAQQFDSNFHFDLYDPIAEMQRLEMDETTLKTGLQTVNELRMRDGRDSLPWGELNTAALANLAQSYFYGAIDATQFQLMAGIPSVKAAQTLLKTLGEMADEEQTAEFFRKVYEEWRKSR